MPLECVSDNPYDEISVFHYSQYIYAMKIWNLQEGLEIPFEWAALIAGERTHHCKRLFEYRHEIKDEYELMLL